MNDFEQRLRQVPVKPAPPGWRAEILAAAQPVPVPAHRETWWERLDAQLHFLFWPHPKAWAGLAVIWVLIFLLNVSQRGATPVSAEKSAPPSPEMRAEIRRQQELLVELVGASEVREADRPRNGMPQPRTEMVRVLMG